MIRRIKEQQDTICIKDITLHSQTIFFVSPHSDLYKAQQFDGGKWSFSRMSASTGHATGFYPSISALIGSVNLTDIRVCENKEDIIEVLKKYL